MIHKKCDVCVCAGARVPFCTRTLMIYVACGPQFGQHWNRGNRVPMALLGRSWLPQSQPFNTALAPYEVDSRSWGWRLRAKGGVIPGSAAISSPKTSHPQGIGGVMHIVIVCVYLNEWYYSFKNFSSANCCDRDIEENASHALLRAQGKPEIVRNKETVWVRI